MDGLSKFFIEGLTLTFPEAVLSVLFGLITCGFKDRISVKKVVSYAAFLSMFMILISIFLEATGLHSFIYIIISFVLISVVFSLSFLTSIVVTTTFMFFTFVLQLLFFTTTSFILKTNLDTFINSMNQPGNFSEKIFTTYICFLLYAIVVIILYRRNSIILNLKKYNLFAKSNNINNIEYFDNIKISFIVLIPVCIFITLNFAIHYYEAFNNISLSSDYFLFLNSVTLIVLSILMILLIRRIITLRHYKIEWTTQQNYLNDVNDLLLKLRAQKHGFVNHINIIYGLLQLEEYESAKEYLADINEAVSTKNNVISVQNPTVSALLNVKGKIAEDRGIKFEVNINDNLSQLNFKAFEIGEAIGNIINNAFDATSELQPKDRLVKIDVYADSEFYIFDIQNTGKTIPKELITKIFDEGFTTKNYETGDHGFGLYITKNILESYQGKISVTSENNYTSFKIYLPKVVKNEFKLN